MHIHSEGIATPGTLGMYILHRLLATSDTQVGTLVRSCSQLLHEEVEGRPAADHCRLMMQFALAADRLTG